MYLLSTITTITTTTITMAMVTKTAIIAPAITPALPLPSATGVVIVCGAVPPGGVLPIVVIESVGKAVGGVLPIVVIESVGKAVGGGCIRSFVHH